MIEKIKSVISPTEHEKHIKDLNKFRKKYVPSRYNQIRLMEYLINTDIDHYVSISNRADGKSFNYMHYILRLAIEKNLGFTFLVRTFTVRVAGQKLLQKILDMFGFNIYDFSFMTSQKYTQVIYKDRTIGIITDLNEASDLKYESNFLQDFPIIIYDEFLALESDYLIDEWERLKTIYSSINRGNEVPYIKIPKIIYLGNAVNFSSPVLANLDLYNILENQPINTIKQYNNIVVELNRNDEANEVRNLRAFNEHQDEMTKAQFKVNKFNIATNEERNYVYSDSSVIYVKLRNNYLKITYHNKTFKNILSVVAYNEYYDYNLLIKDNSKETTFLNETFFDIDYSRYYERGAHLFDNNYSKDFVLDFMSEIRELRINKIIKHHYTINKKEDNFTKKEKQYKENYIKNSKKALFRKFFQ